MNFGCFVPQGWRLDLKTIAPGFPQYQAMKQCALRAERLGYHSLWLYDHFHTIPDAKLETCFEVWTATAALAEATTTIRLGQMCGCNIYRPPALLAKIAANIDVISNGRLDFGLGAGWYQHESVAYGYPFEKPAIRIGQLDEAVQIIKGMWTEDYFQFEGTHYTVGHGEVRNYRGNPESLSGAINHPKPIQKPHPPIWLAGGGEQLTLRTVARYADYSNFMGPLATVQHKNRVLDEHCRKIGRDPKEIKRSININLLMGNEHEVELQLKDLGRSPEDTEILKGMLYPSLAAPLLKRLETLGEEAGVDTVIVYFPDAVTGESMERFAQEIIPQLT